MIVTSLNERDAVPHIDSLHALDWLTFSLAALLTGSGPFVAVKLADRGWMEKRERERRNQEGGSAAASRRSNDRTRVFRA
jgi:hypothetical protein